VAGEVLGQGCGLMRRASLLFLCFVAAVAVGSATHADPSNRVLVARVLSSAELGVFVGDVEEQWYSHAVEAVDRPGEVLRVVTARNDCPEPGGTFRMTVERRRLHFAVRAKADEALLSDLVVTSCAKA
jgi:D-alanyl-D-alanine carboxypeptidase